MRSTLTLAALLLACVAFADQGGGPSEFEAASKNRHFTVFYDPAAKPTPEEKATANARLEALATQKAPLTLADVAERNALIQRRSRFARLSLLLDGLTVMWRVNADQLPGGGAVVTDNGRRVVIFDRQPSTMGSRKEAVTKSGRPLPDGSVLAVLDEKGAVLHSYGLGQVVPETEIDGLTFSVSHVQWLSRVTIDPEHDVAILELMIAPPGRSTRKLKLSTGTWAD